MATNLIQTTFSTEYKDDYRDSDNYHRILFNTGVGLQARELTQLQTILQKQIERFGNNVFKEGAVVKPGGINVNPKYEFIKLNTTDPSHVLPPDITTLVGKTVTGQTSAIVATILEVVAAAGSDPATLYVKYTNTSSAQGTSDVATQRMRSDEIIDVSDGTDLKVKLSTADDPSTGTGTQVTLRSGIYYARGNFVFTQDQSKIISKYTDTPSTDVGFKTVEQIITASDDNALYDNQGAVPNVSAPGADRYRITLTIAERSEILSSENFIHVATVVNGAIFESVTTDQSYNIPNDLIATRIKENSGDYEVKPFVSKFELDSENTHLLLRVSDGTVVVDGYRAARPYPTAIRVQKPTATLAINNEPVNAVLGHHVIVTPSANAAGQTQGVPDIDTMEEMNLRSAVAHGGSTIGTVRVKALTKDGLNIKAHLTDIQMNSGEAFRNVKSVGTSVNNYFDITLDNSKAVLKEPTNDYSLLSLPKGRPSTITDLIYTAQRKFSSVSANSSGVVTLTGVSGNPGEAYASTSNFIFAKADSDISTISPTITLSGGATGGTADFGTGNTIVSSSNIEYAAYITKTQTTPKTKTLTNLSLVDAVESDGAGLKFLNLRRADIFSVDEIVNAADSSQDLASRFLIDNGQRPSRYEPGRLILKNGFSAPSGNVSVKFKFLDPSSSGDYFSVNSYSGQVDYDKIPSYRTPAGLTVNLRNVLDFRSVADSAGNFGTSGSTMIELPQNGTNITADVTYNLAQSAKLAIDKNSNLSLNFGPSGFFPMPPTREEGTLPLYDITLNPKTLNDSDVQLSKINFRRFTMKDVGNLATRIDRLEEFTTLNLLEVDTKNFEVLDSAGNNRTKAGFFVDDFKDHRFSSIRTPNDHRSSIDIVRKQLRALQQEDTIRMIYDSDASTNTVIKGDNVYPRFDEASFIDQTTASKAIQINPFAVTVYNGNIVLSPSSDEWRDTERLPDKIVQKGTLISRRPAYLFDNHITGWCGTTAANAQQTVVTDDSILELVDDRLINTTQLTFMRSRKIFFKATGLRPNTRVFTFLDGINISAFTNGQSGEGGFSFYSSESTDHGNTLKGLTEHPNGSTTPLVTDGMGSVSGSFIIPNNDQTLINSGTREFKILDISVDNDVNAGSIASAPYTAKGYLDTKQAEYTSTRIIYVPYNVNPYSYSSGDGGGGGGDKFSITNASLGSGVSMYGGPGDPTGAGSTFGFNGTSFTGPDGNPSGGPGNTSNTSSGYDNQGPGDDGHSAETDGALCLLEDMMVMLNGRISQVTNVMIGDTVSYGTVIEVMHKHMRTGYYVINDELKITNDHPVLANGSWKRTEDVIVGDYINKVKVESIKYVEKIVPTVYIGVDTMGYDVYCGENTYTVHGHYKEKMQKAC